MLDSISDLDSVTAIEFFEDECGKPFATLFDGTQKYIRERNVNDATFEIFFPLLWELPFQLKFLTRILYA